MCTYTINIGGQNAGAKALAAAAPPSTKKSAVPRWWQPICDVFGCVWAVLPSCIQTGIRYCFCAVCSVVALLLFIRVFGLVAPHLWKDVEYYMLQPLQWVTGSVFDSAIGLLSGLDHCGVRAFSSTKECTTTFMTDAQTMENALSAYKDFERHVYCLEEKGTAHHSDFCIKLDDSCQDNNDTLCGQTLKQLCERVSKSFVAQRGWACDWKDTALNGLAVIAVFAVIAVLIMFASRAMGLRTNTVQFRPATTANGTACKKCLRLGKLCPQHK